MHDPVKSPSHYQLPGLDVEAIDVIQAVLTPEQFEGYCLGNMLKYLLRQGRKDEARQDWGKVGKYHEFLMAPRVTSAVPATSSMTGAALRSGEMAYEAPVSGERRGRVVLGPGAPGAWNDENRQQCCRDIGIVGRD